MTTYLSHNKRAQILKNIDSFVSKKIRNTEPFDTIPTTKVFRANDLKTVLDYEYPNNERIVLKKYEMLECMYNFTYEFIKRKDGEFKFIVSSFEHSSCVKIDCSDNPLEFPKNCCGNREKYFINAVNTNDILINDLFNLFILKCECSSEIKKLVKSYKYILEDYRTVKTLLKNYPQFEQFIPERFLTEREYMDTKDPKNKNPEEDPTKVIEQFEKEFLTK